jgi:hypothetical protein
MIPAVELAIDDRYLIIERGYFSNLILAARASSDGGGWLAAAGSGATPACDGAPWKLTGGRRPSALKLRLHQGFSLWHRSDTGRSFCSPLNADG